MCVCMCTCVIESVCVCVCVCARARIHLAPNGRCTSVEARQCLRAMVAGIATVDRWLWDSGHKCTFVQYCVDSGGRA